MASVHQAGDQAEQPRREGWQIDAKAASVGYQAFLDWAGSSRGQVRLLYGPDPMLAIDTPRTRGFLVDEVYFISVWIDRGQSSFEGHLHDRLASEGFLPGDVLSEYTEPDPITILEMILTSGSRVPRKMRAPRATRDV